MSVHTVLGEIEPSELGVTYGHEHLLTMPGEHLLKGSEAASTGATAPAWRSSRAAAACT